MALLINLPTFKDDRGSLTVIEKALPFAVKRVYYMYGCNGKRGGHRHIKNIQALISAAGSCEIYTNNGREEKTLILDNPAKCLILESKDWHTMSNFSRDCVLLVLASEYYDKNDYISKVY